jgi:hypothetical protein
MRKESNLKCKDSLYSLFSSNISRIKARAGKGMRWGKGFRDATGIGPLWEKGKGLMRVKAWPEEQVLVPGRPLALTLILTDTLDNGRS